MRINWAVKKDAESRESGRKFRCQAKTKQKNEDINIRIHGE